MIARSTLAVLAFAASIVAFPDSASAETYALTAGLMENVAVAPDAVHAGVYPCVGAGVTWETESANLTASLLLEFSPEFGLWGFVPTFAADFPLNGGVGLDVFVTGWNDQLGTDFRPGALYVGVGGGVSFFLTKRATLSPSLTVVRGVRNSDTTVLVPGTTFSVAIGG